MIELQKNDQAYCWMAK